MPTAAGAIGGTASGAALGSAVMPGIGTAAGAVVGFLASLFGGSGSDEDAKAAYEKASQVYDGLDPSLKTYLTQYVAANPQDRAQQEDVFNQMKGYADQGGLDAQSKAAYAQALAGSEQQQTADRQSLLAQAAARGGGGADASFASQLASQQGGAQRMSNAGLQSASDARNRAYQALGAAGQMAGTIRGQGLQERQAQQNVQDLNTQRQYQQQMDQFRQQMSLAAGKQGAYTNLGDYYQGRAASQNANANNMLGDVGQAAGSIYSYGNQNGWWGGGGGGGQSASSFMNNPGDEGWAYGGGFGSGGYT